MWGRATDCTTPMGSYEPWSGLKKCEIMPSPALRGRVGRILKLKRGMTREEDSDPFDIVCKAIALGW